MSNIRKQLAKATTKLSYRDKRKPIENHPAQLHNYQNGDYYRVPIDAIQPDSNQPRKYFDEVSLNELSQSIKEKGVLQPVIIRTDKENKIYLIAGERRFRASKMAGLKEIPAIYSTGEPAEIALIENLQRENLTPLEEAQALEKMMKEHNYTQEKLALIIGKDRTTITTSLSLNKLPKEIKEECDRAHIYPKRLLIEVVRQKTPEKMISLFSQIKKNNIKSTQVREITRKKKTSVSRTPASIVLDKILGLNKSINSLEIETIEDQEKGQLMEELEKLTKVIKKILK